MFNNFFPIVNTYLGCEDIRQTCAMVPRWRLFASCIFSEPSAAHFRHALRPHHVWKYGRHPIADR